MPKAHEIYLKNWPIFLGTFSVYKDDSSDELSEVLDDLLLPASDTEDIWQQDNGDEDESEMDESESEDDDDNPVERIEISSDSDNDDNNGHVAAVNGKGSDDVSMESD